MNIRIITFILGMCLSTSSLAVNVYGPTSSKETLWSIASRIKPQNGISVQQVMLALYRKNPQAFGSENINSLKKGSRLTVPSSREMRTLSRVQAIRSAKQHNIAWKQRFQKVAKQKNRTARTSTSNKQQKQALIENKHLKQRISRLNQKLDKVRAENRDLSNKLSKAQAVQVASLNTIHLPKAVATSPAASNISVDVARKVQKLTAEVSSLKSTIEQKDNQITTLRNNLKSASAAIKRQQVDNELIHKELTQLRQGEMTTTKPSPDALANATKVALPSQPVLQLTAVTDTAVEATTSEKQTQQEVAKEAQDSAASSNVWAPVTDETDPQVHNSSMEPTNDVKKADDGTREINAPHSVAKDFNLIPQNQNEVPPSAEGNNLDDQQNAKLPAPSQISLIIALIALLLIIWLLWRYFHEKKNTREYLPAPERNHFTYRDESIKK